jgi:hypothetical protein
VGGFSQDDGGVVGGFSQDDVLGGLAAGRSVPSGCRHSLGIGQRHGAAGATLEVMNLLY